MSFSEIEKAVDALSPEELAKLAAYIAHHDKLAWDEQLDDDFSPGGKHAAFLKKLDAEIDAGNFTPRAGVHAQTRRSQSGFHVDRPVQ